MAAALVFTDHRLIALEEESMVSLIGGEHLFFGQRGLGFGEKVQLLAGDSEREGGGDDGVKYLFHSVHSIKIRRSGRT